MNKWQAYLRHPKAPIFLLLLGLMLVLPSLFAGLLADDYAIVLRLSQPQLFPRSALPDLFHLFVLINNDESWRQMQYGLGLLPWWTDANLQLAFFRPLAELSHWIDVQLLQANSYWMHAHSLVYYVLLLYLLSKLYHRLCPQVVLANLALLFFVVDASHGFTVAWLANRNALLAVLFSLLACHSLLQKHALWRVLAALLAALLSAEIGIGGVFVALAFIAVLDTRAWRQKLITMSAIILLLAVYLGFYWWAGFGAQGAYYFHPISESAAWMQVLPERFFSAFSMLFNLLPWHLTDQMPHVVFVCGVLIFVSLIVWLGYKKNRVAWFCFLSLCLVTLPATLAPMQERNLLFAGVFSSILLALLVHDLWHRRRYLAWIILFFHGAVSALMLPLMSYAPAVLDKSTQEMSQQIDARYQGDYVLLFSAPLFSSAFISLQKTWREELLAEKLWLISAQNDLQIEQLDTHTWRVSREDGLLQKEDFLLRNITLQPFALEQIIDLHVLKIQIKAMNAQGNVSQILLMLDKNIAAEKIHLLRWRNQQWQVFQTEKEAQASIKKLTLACYLFYKVQA